MDIETVTIKSEISEDEYYPEVQEQIEPDFSGKPFRCGVCGHRTTSDVLLKVHTKMHLLKRIHQCDICKKCFSFVSELNSHMRIHEQEKSFQSLLKGPIKEMPREIPKNRQEEPKKQFKNKNPNVPLNEIEKLLLLEHIEKLGINKKYKEVETIKTYLRNGWAEMVQIFAENGYDRSPDKLARTYFHMKNHAKMHIERFYIHKKLPRPKKVDYIFVRLCPSDFEGFDLDMRELQEDSKIYDEDSSNKEDNLDDKEKMDEMTLSHELVSEPTDTTSFQPSVSHKRNLSNDSGLPEGLPLSKIFKSDDEDIKSLLMKFLIEENQRKEKEHDLEVKSKELDIRRKELDITCREELHKKDIEVKKIELMLLSQKLQQQLEHQISC